MHVQAMLGHNILWAFSTGPTLVCPYATAPVEFFSSQKQNANPNMKRRFKTLAEFLFNLEESRQDSIILMSTLSRKCFKWVFSCL